MLKDFLHLRPVRHFTERRVRGHVAVCVCASIIRALINAALTAASTTTLRGETRWSFRL